MHVLLAPDKFKGSLTAADVADGVGAVLRQRWPDVELRVLPLADGGDGTLDACAALLGGVRHRVDVLDALGVPTVAHWLWTRDPADGADLAVLESAQAVGLARLAERDRNALAAHSFGVGQLLREVDRLGIRRAWLGLGGSACTDGGAGMLAALGWLLLDGQGRELPLGGGALERLADVDPCPSLRLQQLRVLSDVHNPLLGPDGAAAVFAPQKGATTEQVAQLERGLTRLADAVARLPGLTDHRATPGAGAAGGLGWALMTGLGGDLHSGADVLLGTAPAREALAWADWIITGEGRLDRQTLGGKAVQRVVAAAGGRPVSAVVGQNLLAEGECRAAGLSQVVALAATPAEVPAALADPRAACQRAAAQLVRPA